MYLYANERNPNNLKLALLYKKYKNNYTNNLRLSNKNFYEKKFKSVSYNPKLTWQLINEVKRSKTKYKDKIETIISNDKVYIVQCKYGAESSIRYF